MPRDIQFLAGLEIIWQSGCVRPIISLPELEYELNDSRCTMSMANQCFGLEQE